MNNDNDHLQVIKRRQFSGDFTTGDVRWLISEVELLRERNRHLDKKLRDAEDMVAVLWRRIGQSHGQS